MKFKVLVLLFFLAILSPFLVYKYNKDLSKKFVEYYINSRFNRFSPGIRISFSDFELEDSNGLKELVLHKIVLKADSKEIALIKKVSFSFSWNFPFTKLYPISVMISDADLEIPLKTREQSVPLLEGDQIDTIFSFITLLNTDLFVQNIKFNGHMINAGFIRVKKMKHGKVLQLGIHEEKAKIELEIVQSQYDTVAVRVTDFNPNNSVFSPIIRELSSINIADDNFTFSGHIVLNLNKKSVNGIIKDLKGSVTGKIRKDSSFHFRDGKFVLSGTPNEIMLNDAEITIGESQFKGKLYFNDELVVEGKVSNLTSDEILKYWDENNAPEARKWYVDSIKGGLIKSAEIDLKSKAGNLEIKNAVFEKVEAKVEIPNNQKHKKSFISLEGLAGKLHLINSEFKIIADSGKIDGIECPGCVSTVDEEKVTIKGTLVHNLNGLIALAQKVSPDNIDKLAKKANIKELYGKSNANILIQIPYAEEQEVSAKIHVKAEALQADKFYKDFSIENGTAELKIDDETATVDANLISSGENVSVKIVQTFKTQTTDFIIDGSIKVEPIKNSGFIPDFLPLSGKVNGKVKVQLLKNNDLKLHGGVNINHLEEEIAQLFGWEKDPDAFFEFKISTLDDVYSFEQLEFTGKNLALSFKGSSSPKKTTLKSEVLKINNSALKLTYLLQGDTSNLVLTSPELDMSKAKKFGSLLSFGGKQSNIKQNIKITVKTIKLKNALSLANLSLDLQNGDGNLSGLFSDGSILSANFSKDGGVYLDSTNVGTLLKSIGINSGIIGGRASFFLGTKNTRSNEGALVMENFYMQDAPVLARILSLSSLYGIMNVLNGEGIFFEQFFSQFRYSDGIFYISESWLEAAPIGLSVMGILSLAQDEAIIHGSVVPLYKLNKLISKVPIIGMLVTGGKTRGIIAAEYTLIRKMEKSSVSVNTLTTFTPTILHKFFKVFD